LRKLNVNQISGSGNSFGSKVRSNDGSKHKSTSSLKNMTMLVLSNPILSMSTRIRKLGKSFLLNKYLVKSLRDSCKIHTKNMNRSVKMSVNHNRESLVDGYNFTMMFYKIDSCVMRKIIYKNDVVLMTTLRDKRFWTPNIGMNKVKRTLRH
jgi:hypothetical protein